MVEAEETETALFPERVGDRLRAARVKAGLDLSDVATRTRIPQRHLAAIEAGDYQSLPAITYCIGFVKAYARTVGEDEVELARNLRGELGLEGREGGMDHADYDAADPARIPSKMLAWSALGIGALLLALFFAVRGGMFERFGSSGAAPTVASGDADAAAPDGNAAAPKPAAPTTGQVVLTATEDVWFRVYDKTDKVLFEGVKKKGEAYEVPADANGPMIRTGRADQIRVTVAGAEVPALGPAERTVKDVGVSAAALAARQAAEAAPKPGANASATAAGSSGAPQP
jgi:cytoskeleton protein RodZ